MRELYDLLPKSIQIQIDRVVWEKKKKLPELGIKVDPKYYLKKEDILYLFDPLLPNVPEVQKLSDDEKRLFLCAMDPVTWARQFLKFEPRIYQTLLMRSQESKVAARYGRRSGKSWGMMFRILHHAVTRPNYRVIIVTPYMAQVDLMYSDIWQILGHGGLKSNDEIREAFGIDRTLRKPAEIYFKNGSIIRMFTAGANSGGNADTVRGQEADLLVLDELDFFGDSDLSAIMPMLQDTSEEKVYQKTLLVSSTPNGRRDLFYALIDPDNENSGVKEYWYSCYANPLFNKDGEESARQTAKTESAFAHEYIADWGDVAIGVFRHQIWTVSARDYKYQTQREPRHEADHIILGIDWDKYGAGVNFCIIQQLGPWAKEDFGKYKVIQRYELPRDKVTDVLGAGVNEAIMLDAKYDFDYIYTDRGYGERQYEELVSVLGSRVVGVNYASSVKELDANEGIITSEPLKPFAVDNAASIFERGNLILNVNDTDLKDQMLAYMRLKVSAGGRPIFGSSNPNSIGDHAVDALCYSLLGFAEKYGDLIPRSSILRPKSAMIQNILNDPGTQDKPPKNDKSKSSRTFTIKSENAWGRKRMPTKYKRASW